MSSNSAARPLSLLISRNSPVFNSIPWQCFTRRPAGNHHPNLGHCCFHSPAHPLKRDTPNDLIWPTHRFLGPHLGTENGLPACHAALGRSIRRVDRPSFDAISLRYREKPSCYLSDGGPSPHWGIWGNLKGMNARHGLASLDCLVHPSKIVSAIHQVSPRCHRDQKHTILCCSTPDSQRTHRGQLKLVGGFAPLAPTYPRQRSQPLNTTSCVPGGPGRIRLRLKASTIVTPAPSFAGKDAVLGLPFFQCPSRV